VPSFYELLDSMRRQHGIQIIADEVQTGFGRTGKMFGIEHAPIQPDLITIAKSLAGGFPLSGLIGRSELMDAIAPGGLGGTYGGSPVGIAAALAVLDVIEEEGLLERAVEIGNIIRDCIEGLALSNDTVNIAGLRGPGAMIAFDILDDEGKPNAVGAKAVCARALEQGLVLLSCGQHGQAIRILVPLTVSNDTLDTGLKILAKSLSLSSATGPEAA
jgi:4-aminobutyrate aminotransferase/(S)-3-amino-2-methylpropionate transaminase